MRKIALVLCAHVCLFVAPAAAQVVDMLTPVCHFPAGEGNRIVCAETLNPDGFAVIVDSMGVLKRKTFTSDGAWVGTETVFAPITETYSIQNQHIVGPGTNIPLSNEVISAAQNLQSVARSGNGTFFIGGSNTLSAPGNAPIDTVLILKVSSVGMLINVQQADTTYHGATLFNTIALPNGGADFYYYDKYTAGANTISRFKIARTNETNDSIQQINLFEKLSGLYEGIGNTLVSKLPCGNQIFQVEADGIATGSVGFYDNRSFSQDFDYSVSPPRSVRERATHYGSIIPFFAQTLHGNRFSLTVATADGGSITATQFQLTGGPPATSQFLPADTFYVRKLDNANVEVWQKAILLHYLPTHLLEINQEEIALLGISNDAPVVTLTGCESVSAQQEPGKNVSHLFDFSPNPADHKLSIQLLDPASTAKGKILDPSGRLERVFHIPASDTGRFELDLSGIKNGLHFLKIEVPGRHSEVKKLIVHRLD